MQRKEEGNRGNGKEWERIKTNGGRGWDKTGEDIGKESCCRLAVVGKKKN